MKKCPQYKFRECIGKDCAWWVELLGKSPQTGDTVNEGACKMAWDAIIQCEQSKLLTFINAELCDVKNGIAGITSSPAIMSLLRGMITIAEGNRELLLNADRQAKDKQTLLLDKQPD